MADIQLYGTPYCPFCTRAKALLEEKNAEYEEIRVDLQPKKRTEMMNRGGGYTVPQIFINDVAIGGCNELLLLEHQGKLDPLLND